MANILLQWLVTAAVAALHPFFVSVVDINHNAKDATVEISVRVFTDDMEKVLQKYSSKKIDILNPADKPFLESQIASYLNQKLQVKINGQAATMQYIGHEIQKESVWMYLEVPKIKEVTTVDIDCKLLYDLASSQTNLIHARAKGAEKNYKLDYPKNRVSFGF
ncbi:DUF6702 family protein [Sediminibacterium soli]|uniref:DUF6702 family protein n=1 Tax=Sediminibacterium soli TaxID=2698829 RepID=UPI00137B3C6C|nr:DUF6702 family protein [Sediminibacterium soli]NCI46928.1 hypothetical protein [Sediminibacterium soli]